MPGTKPSLLESVAVDLSLLIKIYEIVGGGGPSRLVRRIHKNRNLSIDLRSIALQRYDAQQRAPLANRST